MKIKFKKLEPTRAFLKLFGAGKNTADADETETGSTEDVYEFYYKRGNTYYFRNEAGDKFSIDYKEPQNEFVRGNKYRMDALHTATD